MKLHYSYHVLVERKERFAMIMTHLNYDIGNPVITQNANRIPNSRCNREGIYQTLTSRGIIIIWDESKQEILTIYAARMAQAIAMYAQVKNTTRLPDELFNAIRNNQKVRGIYGS